MAGNYHVEHVAEVPAGFHVRTVTRKGHLVRIAFPPGRRRKGSGKLVEVLHPVRDNPCRLPNPSELVVMMANPSPASPASNEIQAGSELYEGFHGAAADHVDDIEEPSPRPKTVAELGELRELQVRRVAGWKWGSFDFTGRGIRVASNAQGTQLYFIGGDQRISRGELTHLGVDNSKELIDLGEAMVIAYRARKSETDGIPADYEHYFGEETGQRPRIGYDLRAGKPRLFISGGAYHVEARGIVN